MRAVFRKDLRIFVRDRWALLFTVLVPMLVVTIIAEALFHSDSGRLYASPPVNGPTQGVTVDAWLVGPLRAQMAALGVAAH